MDRLPALRMRDALGVVAAIGVTAAILVAVYLVSVTPDGIGEREVAPTAPLTPGPNVIYSIEDAQSAAGIGADLEALGVIRSGQQFQMLVQLMGVSGRLAAGDHLLRQGLPALRVIHTLTVRESGPTIRLTFPEGIRYEEMAEIVEEEGLATADEFLAAVDRATLPADLAASLPEGAGLQGYLFPDTYILPVGSTPDDLVALMIETFALRFNETLRARAAAQGLTVHQAVTLASIVEREAVIAEERPLIAGVFYNRLAANDLIGADPTVQFAVAELDPLSVQRHGWWKTEITQEDLDLDSPYNTRKFPGLPPGPITNPGLASLEAVAMPTETDYYYFVADAVTGDGSHVFAVTEEEHDANVAAVGGGQ